MNGRFKGLALLDPAIGDAELLKLKDGGFTGFRIKSDGRGGMSFDETRRMVTRTAASIGMSSSCRNRRPKLSALPRS